ncbi:uncharacterized protein LACBIDRAFT_335164 [Laccaria bicolor S238N-H82]|uniref:Predicted protein n=1 Tax=Laccaria bicolor (strain S238N-H82 / ATCC MYA-4686) TaxID=486041 RepID=B0E1K0_LACBS|nr:uncharacterized protein LACBIDRAFT_335164 [Laccaria bicolor S238N-H82]EDQ99254.1 predicted protein [Laccaria bicolor S238N-H82]|eukprot:XP_001890064.1 predicted protein [Laccaria bicolor S238N-H82]
MRKMPHRSVGNRWTCYGKVALRVYELGQAPKEWERRRKFHATCRVLVCEVAILLFKPFCARNELKEIVLDCFIGLFTGLTKRRFYAFEPVKVMFQRAALLFNSPFIRNGIRFDVLLCAPSAAFLASSSALSLPGMPLCPGTQPKLVCILSVIYDPVAGIPAPVAVIAAWLSTPIVASITQPVSLLISSSPNIIPTHSPSYTVVPPASPMWVLSNRCGDGNRLTCLLAAFLAALPIRFVWGSVAIRSAALWHILRKWYLIGAMSACASICLPLSLLTGGTHHTSAAYSMLGSATPYSIALINSPFIPFAIFAVLRNCVTHFVPFAKACAACSLNRSSSSIINPKNLWLFVGRMVCCPILMSGLISGSGLLDPGSLCFLLEKPM